MLHGSGKKTNYEKLYVKYEVLFKCDLLVSLRMHASGHQENYGHEVQWWGALRGTRLFPASHADPHAPSDAPVVLR